MKFLLHHYSIRVKLPSFQKVLNFHQGFAHLFAGEFMTLQTSVYGG
jgi:hypothetical protein